MRRHRSAKIVATLGPASRDATTIAQLFRAGADVFRLNFSHGSHKDHAQSYALVRALEQSEASKTCILQDVQGPKLRIGLFEAGQISLEEGQKFRLRLEEGPGDATGVQLPHPEILTAIKPGKTLLLDDGKVRLRVDAVGDGYTDTTVMAGRSLSDRKGVNVPDTVLPLSALTDKDRADIAFGLKLAVDWIALSFVQTPEDVVEARQIIGDQAKIMVKIEKPSALEQLEEIITLADGVMVARGDLGVELPPERVPPLQMRIFRTYRNLGRPVVVATQMLESMIQVPVPTRAETTDVANAIYDGADAVMLSAESAAGRYPVEAVTVMDRIIQQTENSQFDASHSVPRRRAAISSGSDAISVAAPQIATRIGAKAVVCHTRSGRTAMRASRERPPVPILMVTPSLATARAHQLVWGLHCLWEESLEDLAKLIEDTEAIARRQDFAQPGDLLVLTAGVPFGKVGRTNTLRIIDVS